MLVADLQEEKRQIYYMIFEFAKKHDLTVEKAISEILKLSKEVLDNEEIKIYTGVGSRNISEEEWATMGAISKWLASQGWILRSGKADGSDSAFEFGVSESKFPKSKEIYVPWPNFKGNEISGVTLPLDNPTSMNYGISLNLVKEIHPFSDKLSQGALKLHQRNCHQVLGRDLENPLPSKFLLACADEDKEGIPKGGTRTAWMLAKKYNVPCLNIRRKTKQEIFEFLKSVM